MTAKRIDQLAALADADIALATTVLPVVPTATTTAGKINLLQIFSKDPTTARSTLSAAKSGANSDITSLSGLTTPLSGAQGGTGVANTGKTITLGGNLTTSGAFAATLTLTNTTTVTLPTTGTLATLAGSEALTNKSINGLTVTSSTGTLTVANGSTLATSGANSITLTSTGSTNVTLPTTGTLAAYGGGTITTSQPLTVTQTWNAGGVTFEGILVDVTSTASAAASKVINTKVGGTTVFSVDKTGIVAAGTRYTLTGSNTVVDSNIKAGGNFTVDLDAGGLYLGASNDTPLLRGAAGIFKFPAASMSANGTVATVLGSLGPTGSNTTVQEWFTVKNSAGTTRYIPAF